ncbi:MAG: glycosyltransferase [Acidobacteria bacterium]|nr:glycosyltransferase [Acidobacteriota bacterium]
MSASATPTGNNIIGVVVHRNQPVRVLDVVSRLLKAEPVDEVIVIDNDSTPAARAAVLASLGPNTRFVQSEVNSGFGPGVNQGLELAQAVSSSGHIVVAAHDAEFSPSAVGQLAAHLDERPDRGAVSADVGDGQTPLVDPFLGAISEPQRVWSGFEATAYPHGTLVMFRREFLIDVGLFDPRYFAYCEEADLGLRARAAGWQVGIARDTPVNNPQMASNAAIIDYLQLRNTLLLIREHFGKRQSTARASWALYELVAGTLLPGRREPFFSARARAAALLDHARGRYGEPPAHLWRRTR